MGEQFPSRTRRTRHPMWFKFAWLLLSATLAGSIGGLAPAFAQATPPGMQPSFGMGATSPLPSGSTRPVGIPLGSTEIAIPGVSPVNPSQDIGMSGCAGPAGAGSSGALFDGGGLSAGTSSSCAASGTPASPLSASTVGHVGIPLGATELGGAGISPSMRVPGPPLSGNTGSVDSSGNP